MANVKIGKLTIKSDSMCWTIYETVTAGEDAKNPGEEYDRGIGHYPGHYPSLSMCLDAILECDLQRSEAASVQELLAEVRALKKEIRNIKS